MMQSNAKGQCEKEFQVNNLVNKLWKNKGWEQGKRENEDGRHYGQCGL